MDYELTEEQKLIQEAAYKFAVNEIEPIAKDFDRERRYPRDVWKKACETGREHYRFVNRFLMD